MTPRPLRVDLGYMVGNCMAPVWSDGERCWIAHYPITWASLVALHGKFCLYDFKGNRSPRPHGGILDHVESLYPHGEKLLVFHTLNPTDHETIRKLPLRLLTSIGQIYPWDERELIPEPAAPDDEIPVIEVEIVEPRRAPRFEAVPVRAVERVRLARRVN